MSSQVPVSVLFFLPTVSGYLDRVRLLMEVSEGLENLVLLVGRRDMEIEIGGHDRFQIIEAGFRRGWRPWNTRKASRITENLIKQSGLNVVHDTFGNLLPVFGRKARYPQVSFLTSVYGPVGWRLKYVYHNHSPLRLLSRPRNGCTIPQ